MNSFLQALFMSRKFRNELLFGALEGREEETAEVKEKPSLGEEGPKLEKKEILSQLKLSYVQLQKLFVQLRFGVRPHVRPLALRTCLPEMFRGHDQQDSAEFARIFLDILERDLRKDQKIVSAATLTA